MREWQKATFTQSMQPPPPPASSPNANRRGSFLHLRLPSIFPPSVLPRYTFTLYTGQHRRPAFSLYSATVHVPVAPGGCTAYGEWQRGGQR